MQSDQDHLDFLCLLKERGPMRPAAMGAELNHGLAVLDRIASDLIALDLIETKRLPVQDRGINPCWVLTDKGQIEVHLHYPEYLQRREEERQRRKKLAEDAARLAREVELDRQRQNKALRMWELEQQANYRDALKRLYGAEEARQEIYRRGANLLAYKDLVCSPRLTHEADPIPPLSIKRDERRCWEDFLSSSEGFVCCNEKELAIEDLWPSSFAHYEEAV